MIVHTLSTPAGVSIDFHTMHSEDAPSLVGEALFVVFPGFPKPLRPEFVESLLRPGEAWMVVSYLGMGRSSGEASPEAMRRTVVEALAFARGGRGVDASSSVAVAWSYRRIVPVGYSFGANQMLASGALRPGERSVLVAPLPFVEASQAGPLFSDPAERDRFFAYNREFLAFVRRDFAADIRGIASERWDAYFSGQDAGSRVEAATLAGVEIDVVYGVRDEIVPQVFVEALPGFVPAAFRLHPYDTGHDKELFRRIFEIL
jgi:hypothetical protein